MSKKRKKKELFLVRKNRYGNPIIWARSNISFVHEGTMYDEVHISANAISFELSLVNSQVWNAKPVGTLALWDRDIYDKEMLAKYVKEIVDGFKNCKPPSYLPPLSKQYAGVLV